MEHVNTAAKDKSSVGENVSSFLIKYRIVFLSLIAALLVLCVAFGVYTAVSEKSRAAGLAEIQEIVDTLAKAQEADYETARADAIKNLSGAIEKSGVVGVRANMALADIYFAEAKWQNACDAWLAAAEKGPRDYTAPMCWYNAAVCYEELGDTASAITYFQKAADTVGFGLASRALFNIGRIKDTAGDYEGAVTVYQQLNDAYPSDSWASLAMSRIIALRAEGKVL